MPRIKFLQDFTYKPVPQQTYVYNKGDVVLVTQDIANKAISTKKAEATEFVAPPSGINQTISKFKKPRKRENSDELVDSPEEVVLDENSDKASEIDR